MQLLALLGSQIGLILRSSLRDRQIELLVGEVGPRQNVNADHETMRLVLAQFHVLGILKLCLQTFQAALDLSHIVIIANDGQQSLGRNLAHKVGLALGEAFDKLYELMDALIARLLLSE